MTFSVIIPCYNCEKTLETTVDSIRMSGLTDYEIVLIDDGSTDGTAQLCDKLCSIYKYIRCIHQENAGVSAARNRGIDEAKGEYVWFVDSDDTIEPFNMETITQAVSEGIDCIMFGMQFLYMWHGRLIMKEKQSCGIMCNVKTDSLANQFVELFNKNYFTTMCNKFVKKTIIFENNLAYDISLINYEDLHLCLNIIFNCKTLLVLPDTYYQYINTFGHDHTVDRIQRIPNIITYTDKVVAPFYALNNKLSENGCAVIEGLSEIILRLYMEAVYFKLQTSDISSIKQLCSDIRNSKIVHKEERCIEKLSKTDKRLYKWMMNNSYVKILLFMKYRAVRKVGSRIYRIMRSYLGI